MQQFVIVQKYLAVLDLKRIRVKNHIRDQTSYRSFLKLKFIVLQVFILIQVGAFCQVEYPLNVVPQEKIGLRLTNDESDPCATDKVHQFLMSTNPKYSAAIKQRNHAIDSLRNAQNYIRSAALFQYTIPVVVHVIHLGETVGVGSNISDAQIIWAIDGLNDRFSNTPPYNTSLDIEIDFCLATSDPYGLPTSGINRVNGTSVANFSTDGIRIGGLCDNPNEEAVKDLSRWPIYDYYNIWVVHTICGDYNGYARFPGGPENLDGLVIIASKMTEDATTLVHEVGHGLDLYHTFQGESGSGNCPEDYNCPASNGDCWQQGDMLCDTPPHKHCDCGEENPCDDEENWDNSRYNYMSYCFNPDQRTRFTPQQKVRMRITMEMFPRSALIESHGCEPPLVPFITIWDTENPGVSNNNQITIPGSGSGYTIWWEQISSNQLENIVIGNNTTTITLPAPGLYRIRILPGSGTFNGISFDNQGDRLKLISIEQWGDISWSSMAGAFAGCNNLILEASDIPDLSGVTNMSSMFMDCSSLNSPIGNWNTSSVTNMANLFDGASLFNGNIGGWNTSNVTNMSRIFAGASSFNQAIGGWNTTNVSSMAGMFTGASFFNKPIGGWNTGNVTDMEGMFSNATLFNQAIGNWNTANVTNMYQMFYQASEFDKDLSDWNTFGVINMGAMFYNASEFNKQLGNWNLHQEVFLENMLDFCGMSCETYDQTLIGWANNSETPDNCVLGAEGMIYWLAQDSRDYLVDTKNWTIGGDQFDNCSVCDHDGICEPGETINNCEDCEQFGDPGNTSLAYMEYFFDSDPGPGNGAPLSFANESNSIATYPLSLSTLSPGVHIIYVRAKNNIGKWGFTHRKLFYIRPEIEGQNRLLTNLEYFIDTDPGYGMGTALTLENNINSIDSYQLPLDALNPGIHVIYVRGKDNKGNWGFTHRKLFYIRPEPEGLNQLLTNLEYFIDTDPGFGEGIPLDLVNSTNSVESYILPLDTLDPGVHVIYARGKDNAGQWSFTQRKLFYIRPDDGLSNSILTNLEYFFDTDPGFGNGHPMTLENDTNSIESYILPLDTLEPGVHVLYIRGKDSANQWSFTQRKLFYIRPGEDGTNNVLTDLEYFIDNGPGFGEATPLTLENDSNSIASYMITLDTFTPGLHTLFMRAKDNQGKWSFTVVKPFTIYIVGPIVYVDWNATGQNIGTSWTNAFTTLPSALLLATLYDTIQEIWIAEGTYKPTSTADRNLSFVWSDSTKVYGGFVGNETDRSQRTTNPSLVVLSGDIGMSSHSTDNSYHVVVIDSTCQNCILDRLTIKLGYASLASNDRDKGAGIYSMGNAEIKDVVVEYSSAQGTGAAVYNIGSGADLRMMNCTFRFNDSPNGHDVHNAGGANIIIEGNVQIED